MVTKSFLHIGIFEYVRHEVRVKSFKARIEIQKCQFKSTSYKFKSISYKFKSTNANPRIIKSMKSQVNSLKISSSPKIINPKLFGWVRTLTLKEAPKFSTAKSPRYFFRIFNTKCYAVSFNYYCQALEVPLHRINGGLSDNGCSSVPLASAYFPS